MIGLFFVGIAVSIVVVGILIYVRKYDI